MYRLLALAQIELDNRYILNKIQFDFDLHTLTIKSYHQLDEVVSWMNNHPTICIELSGHTDDMGSDEHNLDLSRKRAQAVKSSLISKHISTVRIAATGYGKDRPIADRATEAHRSKNRRVEI